MRPEIQALTAYAVATAVGLIKLDAMENPYSLPESLRSRIAAVVAEVPVNRYPDGAAEALKAALRAAYGIDPGFGVLLGNGSDEIIQIIASTLARPGAAMLAPEPTFVMYRMNALYAGMRFIAVPLRHDFSLDLEAMLAAIKCEQPALIFLAYPNNPTGNLFDNAAIHQILAAAPGLVVVDEAYHAFAEASFLPRLATYPNLLVLRTVSKIGMAGLRLGYAVSAPAWTEQFEKVRQPYNLNALTQAVAPILLGETALLASQAREIRNERTRLERRLTALPGVTVYRSHANFVLARVPDAPQWFAALKDGGILVKNLHGWHDLLAHCLRITVGTPQENNAVLSVLESLS